MLHRPPVTSAHQEASGAHVHVQSAASSSRLPASGQPTDLRPEASLLGAAGLSPAWASGASNCTCVRGGVHLHAIYILIVREDLNLAGMGSTSGQCC